MKSVTRVQIPDKAAYFYHSEFGGSYLHLYCHIHNVSVDVSSGLLQVFLVELGSQHGTSNHVLIFNPHRLKRRKYDNRNEDNNPKTLNDTNHQTSSQKFKQGCLCFTLILEKA